MPFSPSFYDQFGSWTGGIICQTPTHPIEARMLNNSAGRGFMNLTIEIGDNIIEKKKQFMVLFDCIHSYPMEPMKTTQSTVAGSETLPC